MLGDLALEIVTWEEVDRSFVVEAFAQRGFFLGRLVLYLELLRYS